MKQSKSVDRYDGQPFLRLVDCFVMKCIGHLDAAQEAQLALLTPKFQHAFRTTGTWEEIVIAQLRFPPDIRESIRELWQRNQQIAKRNRTTLKPEQFVEMFVRSNVTGS